MRFFLPTAAALLLILPATPIAHAQTKPDNPTPLSPTPEAQSLVQQLLREGKVMRSSDAKRGMKGYALSVFQGTKVEKFNIEVLGTLERVNGGGDLVMIRVLDGPVVTRQSGIIQGMSGSPVYINGKLLGAIAIGFGFPKEPIGGVTPITQMIEGALPDNAPRPAPVKVASARASVITDAKAVETAQLALAQAQRELTKAPPTFSAPPRSIEGAYTPKEPLQIGARRVTRVAVSSDLRVPDWSRGADGATTMAMRPCTRLVLLSGVSPASLPRWKNLFAPYGLTPMIGGGAMSKSTKAQVFGTPSTKTGVKANLAPGAAIGVQLASGDVDATGVGTVTYRLGNRLLAFGHPMFNLGGVSMPMTTAYVHDIFPAYDISFKLASPIDVVGELQQDTNFAIGGTVGRVAQTVPMHISLVDPAKKINRDWNMKLIKDPLFTPQLATNIAVEALQSTLGLDSGKTVNVAFRMRLKNGALINRRNTVYSDGEVIQGALNEMLSALSITQQNPFEKGDIAGIDLNVEIVPERKTALIRQITADRNRVKAGEKVTISVELEPTGKPDETVTKRFVVTVPDDAPNGLLRVAVGPADSYWSLRAGVGGTPPNPANLPELLDAYEKVGASDVLELQASTPDRFLLVDRKKVSDPPPLWGRLVPQTASSSLRAYNETVDLKQKSEYVLSGLQSLSLPVESVRPSDRNEPVDGTRNADGIASDDAFSSMNDGQSTMALDDMGDGDMATDWTRFDAPGNYRRLMGKLNLQIPSKGNEPPKLPGAEPTPTPPVVTPKTPVDPVLKPTPTPSPTPDPKANSIARPPGRWIQKTAADFGGGNFYGAVVRDDGAIVPGPREKEVVSSAEPVAWSLAVAPDNTIYVGTGFNARLLQIRNGVSRVLYQGSEVAITALALDKDGTLYAGASPGGRVYRFLPNGKRETLLQTRETFVHALKLTPQGLLVATGGPRAALYRVDNPATVSANPIAKPLVVLPQTHLNSLDVSGSDIYAGTGDDAVLYRVNSAGEATALYQATNPTAQGGTITIQSGGRTQVIAVGANGAPVQGGATGASTNPLLRRGGLTGGNEITAIATDENGVYFGTLGSNAVYRYTAARGVEEYWKSPMGAIYALSLNGGALYAGCDEGAVWRLSGEIGNVRAARVLDASQPQVLALAGQGQTLFAATANNAAVYQIGASTDGKGNEYDSDIFDAKSVVKWGALRSIGEGVAIETRSGNTVDPDATWSNWAPLEGERIVSPAGRYLQYRAKLNETGSLSRVEALYRAPNRAPKVEWSLPTGGEFFSGTKTLTWKGTDPDSDTLRYSVELSAPGAPFESVINVTPTDPKITLKTEKYPDGTYRARVRASDAARNPEDPLFDESVSQPFVIDNTAPTLNDLTITKSGGEAAFSTSAIWKLRAQGGDATSPLAGAEWRVKPLVEAKTDKAKDKTKSKSKSTETTVITTTVSSTDEANNSETDDDAKADDDAKPDSDTLAEIAAAKKTRSLWQAIGTADGLFDDKNEGLVAILDGAFSPIPLSSGMEIEVRLRDAAGNQTVKTLKLP